MIDHKWDMRYLELAKHVAQYSKDPSTQTGAVIVDKNNRVISMGYNGFPRGVLDTPERYTDRAIKLKMIVHCEVNAMIFAKVPLDDCTLYTWPFASCSNCAGVVIQSGITRCVAPVIPEELKERWAESLLLSENMFSEAGIQLDYLEMEK
jgi:dCMP deaminase